MGSEPITPVPDSSGVDLYHLIGESDGCQKLSVAFYAHVDHDPVLRPLYPPTLTGCPIKSLSNFLTQFLGGPREYESRRWALSLREAHHRFKIGQKERAAWLNNMFQAIDEVNIQEPLRSPLRWWFEEVSTSFINHPQAEVSRPDLSLLDISAQNIAETSHIHKDIAQRWQAQWMVEEVIFAVRQGNTSFILAWLEGPAAQASFTMSRTDFLSFLAILSISEQSDLLDYVQKTLVNNLELVQQRYTNGRTLLHEVAGQGNQSIVELLLNLGADPNAKDRFGHTPLYFVGNALFGTNGAEIVRVLVKSGANVNAQEKLKHCTALHMAARRENIQVAKALLDFGADLEARDILGDTPLRRAVNCGKLEMVAFLLSQGANIETKAHNGLTPWQVAKGAAMKQLLQSFLESKASK